jgi:hypothetical protein
MRPLDLSADGAVRTSRATGTAWARGVQLVRVAGTYEARTPDGEETLLVLLGGTLDLFAGGSSWLQRGLRDTPFSGRPCGVFLPPALGLRAVGDGELLLISTRKPEPKPAPTKAAPAASGLMGLLPMSGSGKAYDPRTGTWEMLERFPTSPEAVLPRAIETLDVAGVRGERIFGFGFKAEASCLDEFVLAPGQTLALPRPSSHAGQPFGAELTVFVRSEGEATLGAAGSIAGPGDAVFVGSAEAPYHITAARGRAYVAAAWSGGK